MPMPRPTADADADAEVVALVFAEADVCGRLGAGAAGVVLTEAGGSATTCLWFAGPPPSVTAATAAAVATPAATPAAVTAPALAPTNSLTLDTSPSTPAAPAPPVEAR